MINERSKMVHCFYSLFAIYICSKTLHEVSDPSLSLVILLFLFIFDYILIGFHLQASFVIPRGQSNRSADIEMGTQRSGELGLEFFFKQVAEKYFLDFIG